jgi:hypothetical protein
MKKQQPRKQSAAALHKTLLKLPKIAKQIQKNANAARARLRFLLLVTVKSAGPGGGDAAQQELDRNVDELQALIDSQQQQLANAAGTGGQGSGGNLDKPCGTYLQEYQAALQLKQYDTAAKYLDKYTACLSRQSNGSPITPLRKRTS